jgi:RNA polymerase sigma factor (sigma-70 family)
MRDSQSADVFHPYTQVMAKERITRGSRLRPLAKAVLRTQSDERLVALAREGREAAFEEIVRRYRPGLVAFAAAYAPPDRIEDVVQESLVRSWQALGQATEEIHLKPWLYTIVRNRALNARRDAKLHEPLSDRIDGVPQPPEIVLDREELASVVAAVGALPESQRRALVRSALEGHTHEQIAAALGSSPGAVRQLIYRARLNLRSGVGMLIPLPLVRLLSEYGAETTAVAGGVAAGGVAIGAAGGGSALSKVAMVAAASAIAAGAGVAIDRSKDDRPANQTVAQQREESGSGTTAPQGAATAAGSDASGSGSDDGAAGGAAEDRDDDSGSGSDDSGPGSDDSGPSASSGPSPEVDEDADEDNSGPGGGGHSGPGGGDEPPEPPEDGDNSGPGGGGSGSGSSGLGSSGSGSSGSGSGDEPPDPY